MKKQFIICTIVILFIVIIINSCVIRKSEPITGKVVDTNNPHVRNGQLIYMTYCQKCHPMGEGGLGPALNSIQVPSFVTRFQVRHGLGVMPYFKKDQISKEGLHDVTAYMSALKKL